MERFHYARIITLTMLTFVLVSFGNIEGAQDSSPVVLDEIVVSASRIPSSLVKTPSSTTIINREQIEARNPISTIDLLLQIPGLHIDQPGGRGGVSSVYVRGSDPNFTVVVIDGVKVNDPTNSRGGSFDFSTLDPASIERVEIVRGPLSSVYGSDAMGGVISIITRQGTASTTTSIEGSGGSHGYHRTGFEARGPLGIADYAINFAYVDNGSPVEGSAFTSKSINAKVTISTSNTSWLQLVSRYADSRSENFPDDSGGPEFAVLRDVDKRDTQELTAGVEFGHDMFHWWEYSLKAAFYDRQEDVSSPGVAPGIRDPFGIPPNSSDNSFRRENFVVSNLFSLSAAANVNIGFEIQFEEGESDGFLLFGGIPVPNRFDLDRTIYASFLEAEYFLPVGLTIQGGLRIDDPDNFDSEVSPRVGLLYQIKSTQTTLKANWGEGFKLPSFFALGNVIVGNLGLVPETSKSFDIGIVQDVFARKMTIRGTFFHNRFFNLIDFKEGPPPRLVNRSEVSARGIELELELNPADNLWINSNVTYTKTDIKGTSEELRNRPEWRSGINARWRPKEEIVTNLGVLYVGDVRDSSIAKGDRILDDYYRVDVATKWTMFTNWQLSVAVDNLFDADYEEAVGFPAPGITTRIAVRLIF